MDERIAAGVVVGIGIGVAVSCVWHAEEVDPVEIYHVPELAGTGIRGK